jgi:hypothetical protein
MLTPALSNRALTAHDAIDRNLLMMLRPQVSLDPTAENNEDWNCKEFEKNCWNTLSAE